MNQYKYQVEVHLINNLSFPVLQRRLHPGLQILKPGEAPQFTYIGEPLIFTSAYPYEEMKDWLLNKLDQKAVWIGNHLFRTNQIAALVLTEVKESTHE